MLISCPAEDGIRSLFIGRNNVVKAMGTIAEIRKKELGKLRRRALICLVALLCIVEIIKAAQV